MRLRNEGTEDIGCTSQSSPGADSAGYIVLHCSQYFPYEDHLPSSWDLMLPLRRAKTNVEVKPINLVAPMLIVYIN